jgi:hypothetical protein
MTGTLLAVCAEKSLMIAGQSYSQNTRPAFAFVERLAASGTNLFEKGVVPGSCFRFAGQSHAFGFKVEASRCHLSTPDYWSHKKIYVPLYRQNWGNWGRLASKPGAARLSSSPSVLKNGGISPKQSQISPNFDAFSSHKPKK